MKKKCLVVKVETQFNNKYRETQEERKERLKYSKCVFTQILPNKKTIYKRKAKYKNKDIVYYD
jgi:hypothetical protein